MNDEEIATRYKAGASIAQIMKDSGFGRVRVMSAMRRTNTPLRENASAAVPVLLTREELPEEYHSLFHFEKQYVDGIGDERRGLVIERDCVECGKTYPVIVSNIRADIKRGRKMRGKCKDCKRDGVVTNEGYVLILKPDHPRAYAGRYVPQHILVMEEHLGRYLDTSAESVHHKNGDRGDNDISNLQLRNRYHGAGQVWKCRSCGSHDLEAVDL